MTCKVLRVNLQNLANYEEYLDINFELVGGLNEVGPPTDFLMYFEIGVTFKETDLRILAKYLKKFGMGLDFVSVHF